MVRGVPLHRVEHKFVKKRAHLLFALSRGDRDSRSFLQRAIQRRAIDLIKPSNEAPLPSSIIATASRICDGVNETGLPSFSPRTGFSKGDGAQSLMVRMDLRQIPTR